MRLLIVDEIPLQSIPETDNFAWLDVADRRLSQTRFSGSLRPAHKLYAVFPAGVSAN
jgi:hypothetical protein